MELAVLEGVENEDVGIYEGRAQPVCPLSMDSSISFVVKRMPSLNVFLLPRTGSLTWYLLSTLLTGILDQLVY